MPALPRLLAALLATASIIPTAAQAAPAAARLTSTFFEWNALPVTPTKTGSVRNAVDAPTSTFDRLSIHVTTLNPGQTTHPPLGRTQEEAILVKDGILDVSLNGKMLRAKPGSLLFLASHASHSLIGGAEGPVTYYVIDVYTPATLTVPNQPADQWAPADKLHSTIFDCESIPAKPLPSGNGERRVVVASPTVTYAQFESHLTTLFPGKSSGLLTDPADEVLIVKSGLVEVTIKGVACRLDPGSFYFQAANDEHNVTNLGPTPATYQVFKWVVAK